MKHISLHLEQNLHHQLVWVSSLSCVYGVSSYWNCSFSHRHLYNIIHTKNNNETESSNHVNMHNVGRKFTEVRKKEGTNKWKEEIKEGTTN